MIEIIESDYTTPGHAAHIVALMDDYAQDIMGDGKSLPDTVKENLVNELKKRDAIHTILALVQGKPAGLAICMEGFSTFSCKPLLNIHDLVVGEAYRGRGISKLILAEAEAVAKRLGCCKLTLEVLEGNAVAISLYQSIGFQPYELDKRMGRALFLQKLF